MLDGAYALLSDVNGRRERRCGWSRIGLPSTAFVIALGLWLGGPNEACGLNPKTMPDGYTRQGWSTENGLPQNSVHAMLQTSDGFLWFGTEAGLARFDGYQFRVFSRETTPGMSGDDIRCLLEDRSGALWVGTGSGLTRLKDGRAETFGVGDQGGGGAVQSLVETGDGRLWVISAGGLTVAKVEGGGSSGERGRIAFRSPAEMVGDAAKVLAMARDEGTGLWVGTSRGLEHVAAGRVEKGPASLVGKSIDVLAPEAGGRSLLIGTTEGVLRLREGVLSMLAQGEMLPATGIRSLVGVGEDAWAVGRNSASLIRGQKVVTFVAGRDLPGTQISAVIADRRGAVWIGTNAGLARYWNGRMEGSTGDRVPEGAAVLTLLEDREGDLWVGTETAGVRILRDRMFQMLPGSSGSEETPSTSVLQSGDGAMWIGTNGGGVTRVSPKGSQTFTTRDGLASETVLALAGDRLEAGDVWVGTPDGLSRRHDGRWQVLTSADGLADDLVRTLLTTKDGAVWIGSRHGATRWAEGKATILTKAQGLGSDLVGPMLEDAEGVLWIGTSGGLTRVEGASVKNYTVADGLPSKTITTLEERVGGGFWVGTNGQGLGRWDGSRFRSFPGVAGIPREIDAMLDDGAGSLWMTSDRGIARAAIADLEQAGAGRGGAVAVVSYGAADGLPSLATGGAGSPAAWRLTDGRLCFATRRGVVTVDPSLLPGTEGAPPVAIEEITVDDRSATREEIASMAPGPSHFAFSFAGLSFAAPQRVQYRYMLEGLDRAWIEAGGRRVAYYTNLRHGRYVFEVSARSAGGPWSAPAAVTLELRPHVYETGWFRVLLAMLVGLIGLGLYRIRVRALNGRFQAVGAERSRIAREIHDTLAQSFVAVSVRLEIMSQMLKSPAGVESCREQLDETRGLVRASLAEARQSIWSLRAEGAGTESLPARLTRLAQEAKAQVVEVQMETTGTYRPLARATEDEVFRIAQESVANAIRHAGAGSLELRLRYRLESLALEIADDGRGFTTQQVASMDEGHFGLTGMRERARLLGAELELRSEPGGGTRVTVRVPLGRDKTETKGRMR